MTMQAMAMAVTADALLRHADDPQVPRGLSDRFPHPYTRADGEAFLAGRVVDFGHEIVGLLGRDTDRLDVEGGAVDDGAGGARSLDGHVEHGV